MEPLHLKSQNLSRLMEVHFDEISHESVSQLDAWKVKGALESLMVFGMGEKSFENLAFKQFLQFYDLSMTE